MDGYSSSFSLNHPYAVSDSADSLGDKGVPVSELQSGGLTPGLKTRYGLVERSIRLERKMRRTPMTFPELLPTMEERLAETRRSYRPLPTATIHFPGEGGGESSPLHTIETEGGDNVHQRRVRGTSTRGSPVF